MKPLATEVTTAADKQYLAKHLKKQVLYRIAK